MTNRDAKLQDMQTKARARKRAKWERIQRDLPELAAFILAARKAGLDPQEPELTEL